MRMHSGASDGSPGGSPPDDCDPARVDTIPILVLPYDRKNPYQDLLYEPMLSSCPPAVRIYSWQRHRWVWPVEFVALTIRARWRGCRLVHLHWLAFNVAWGRKRAPRLSTLSTKACLRWLDVIGYRLVWTAHNLLPHEAQTSDDPSILRALVRQSRAVIVNSQSVQEDLAGLGIPARTTIVPHGNYVGRYTLVGRAAARSVLGLPRDRRIFLFVGIIRPYKGLDDLLRASVCLSDSDLLAVVGEATDAAEETRLSALAGGRYVRRSGVVPEDELGRWLSAADVVCLPFRRVTTSGSALLALSAGLPIVAPRLGALADLPDSVGFFYDPLDPTGLCRALLTAQGATVDELRTRGADALRFARTLDWDVIAGLTLGVYRAAASEELSSV